MILVLMCSGNWKQAFAAVRHLVDCLISVSKKGHDNTKFSHIVPQILLSSYFEEIPLKGSTNKGFQWGGVNTLTTSSSQYDTGFIPFSHNLESDASNYMSNSSSQKSEVSGFVELIKNLYKLAAITDQEKVEILALVDLLNEISNVHSASAYQNLDEPGRRY